uniref:Heavy-metal-associated domain-containing protein n=1 Tax=Roseihalotalea indica TaxID=2867963 RepID=A0AA49GQ60_9BACT|nr:heavy-metal-associated domain-containing protein [Tunicatimonas sp. TK19036]
MDTLKYKTNINCGGCVATVTPFLDKLQGVQQWEVDTQNPDKVLTVNGEDLQDAAIRQAVEEAGFNAERISDGWFKKMLSKS